MPEDKPNARRLLLAMLRWLPTGGRLRLTVLVTLAVAAGVAPVVSAVLTGTVVGSIPSAARAGLESPAGHTIVLALALIAVLFAVQQAAAAASGALAASIGSRMSEALSERMMRSTLDPAGVAHLDDPAVALELEHARKLETEGESLNRIIGSLAHHLTRRVAGLGSAVVLATFRWWVPIPIAIAGELFRRAQDASEWEGHRWREEHVDADRRAEYHHQLALRPSAAKEIRLFGLRDLVAGRQIEHRMVVFREVWRLRRTGRARVLAIAVAAALAEIVGVLAIARAAATGELSLGEVAVFAQALVAMWELTSHGYWWLYQGAGPIPHVEGLAGACTTPLTALSGTAPADGMLAKAIRFEDVRFAYAGGREVLAGLDLDIPAGRSLAIVGLNGAGKTTLVKLLCRLHDPSWGRITVDGTDLRDVAPDAWRARVSAIFQDFVRYELPLRDNVDLLGRGGVSEALRLAGGSDLAPLDAPLSRAYRGGTDLSGGQWQKVAIARALHATLRGAGVLVLDEPTANLDVRAEAELFERLLAVTHGLTVVLVSHRFSTVRRADRIAVIESGRVVEDGTHDELVALGGRYARMFGMQAERFRAG